jgi:hypothetical protein
VPAAAQPSLEDLQKALAVLQDEVLALRRQLEVLQGSADRSAAPAAPPDVTGGGQPDATPTIEMLRAQVAELAQVKVESQSRLSVRLSGTVHAHVFANSANANWLESPNLVNAPPQDGSGSFSASLRQTRIGLAADGPDFGGWRASGNLAFDFFGGVPAFQTGQTMGLPRLLVAYVRLTRPAMALEIGQDHVLLAPRDPTSLATFAFPGLFRSGNLYLRAPQVRVERAFGRLVNVAAGIVAPIGGDLSAGDAGFAPPALGGERSRRPGLQARLLLGSDDEDLTRRGSLGVSGHVGWERRAGQLDESWAVAVDFGGRRDRLGVAGELFVGADVDAFGGAIGLDRRAAGGWVELRYFVSPRWSVNGGYGLDALASPPVAVARRRNQSVFANVIVAITPEIDVSLEYKWLATTAGSGARRGNHHVDWVLVYRF